MAGETIRTEGIVLSIRPWSRTSHVVTWLTPDCGCVATLVKGAVRPKSLFLGQYDMFYSCGLLYYARASGDLHVLREAWPLKMRDGLRVDWRAISLAGYAAGIVKDIAPPGVEAKAWHVMMEDWLDKLCKRERDLPAMLLMFEMGMLRLAGLVPDFSGMDPAAEWTPFALDSGRCGEGRRTVRLVPSVVAALERPDSSRVTAKQKEDAIRFLGVFLSYHLDTPHDVRRTVTGIVTSSPA